MTDKLEPGRNSGLSERISRHAWARFGIAEGIELNIRRDIEVKNIRKIDEIIKVINSIIKETEND